MSDDRFDHTPHVMPGGTFTSGHEIHEAGAQPWQSSFEKEQAVGRLRTQKMNDSLMASSTYTSTYAGSVASGPPNYKGLLIAVVLGLIAFFAYTAWNNARINMPWHFGVFQDRAFTLAAKDVAGMREMNANVYKKLFVEGAPMRDLYKGCRFKNCIDPDWPAFKLMQPFALNPALYENDVCSLLFEREPVRYSANLLKPEWKIGPTLPGTLNPNSCMLVNHEAVWAGVQRHRTWTNVMVFGGAGLAAALLFFLAFRKKTPEAKA